MTQLADGGTRSRKVLADDQMYGQLAKNSQLFVPSIAVVIGYASFFSLPNRREYLDAATQSQALSTSIEQLSVHLTVLRNSISQNRESDPVEEAKSVSISIEPPIAENEPQSSVQQLVQIVSTFESHGTACAAVESVETESDSSDDGVTHRLSIIGGYSDVLAAMQAIEAAIADVRASELKMNRTEVTDNCQWDITFDLNEGPK
ncbi:MAG: hypothetical protein KDB27_23990 [Planctomycetales bacterium]|nr:hypothetical protein [Planctomycetales bacterium]